MEKNEKRIYLFIIDEGLQMIVAYPEFFQGSQIVGVGSSPSRLCQRESVDVAKAIGIVDGRLVISLFCQTDSLLGAYKSVTAGLQLCRVTAASSANRRSTS